MIEPHVFLLADHGASVELQIAVIDRGGSGIKKVMVRDNDRLEVFSAAPAGCPIEFTFNTPAIPSTRFPIFVEGTDCNDRISGTEEPFPLLPPGVIGEPGIPRVCSSLSCTEPTRACNDAVGALERARRPIVEKCAEISALRERRDAWIALSVTFGIAAFIMFAVAAVAGFIPFVGQGLVAIFAGIGALFLAASILFGSLAASVQFEIEAKQRELGTLRTRFLDEVSNVRENCCVECISTDLTLPDCD